MSLDPLEQRIAQALRAKADEVTVRDRLAELARQTPQSRGRPVEIVIAAAFIAAIALVGGVLLVMRGLTDDPAAETATTLTTAQPPATTSTTTTETPPTTTTTTTTEPPTATEPSLDIRQQSGPAGGPLIIHGTAAPDSEVLLVFSDPATGETWPDEVDGFAVTDERGSWRWAGTFPTQLQSNDRANLGELRPITPGFYEVRVESFGDVLLAEQVEVLPGNATDEGPSQTSEEAARDGVISAIAEMTLDQRLSPDIYESVPEGVWVLSQAATAGQLWGSCNPEDPGCAYGRDYVYGTEYAELLLMDAPGREIVKAFPMPAIKPSWMYVSEDYVYTGRIGDGAVPQNSLIRVDRGTLELTALIFEDPEDEYAWFGDVVANDEWLDGWQVLGYDDIAEPFLTMNENTIDGVQTPSHVGITYINLDVIEAIFERWR